MISLPLMLARAAKLNPKGAATSFNERVHTWTEVVTRVSKGAAALKELGVEEGDRVALLALNSDRYFEALFSVPWAGGVLVPLNTRWALAENEYALRDSEVTTIIFDDAFAGQVEMLKESLPQIKKFIYIGEEISPSGAVALETMIESMDSIEAAARGDSDLAGIFYTGGTTGFPKGVMQTHEAIYTSTLGAAAAGMSLTPNDSYIHAAPMFHMADYFGTMSAVMNSANQYFMPQFTPAGYVDLIEKEQITHSLLVPAMLKMVLALPDIDGRDLSSLAGVWYGASPMPAATLAAAMEGLPSAEYFQAYGQTEMAPVISVLNAEDHKKGGACLRSAGRPTATTDIRIVKENGDEAALHEVGEVWARGRHSMKGYWKLEEQTADTLVDGWVKTGDAAYRCESGYLYIVDRVKDMIITGGENVFTTEVESVLSKHPQVKDSAVIGIPSDEWGEAVHAVVVVDDISSGIEADLIEFCKQHIAGYKCPKSVSLRADPLPLSGANKVLKNELRAPFWTDSETNVN